MTKVLIPLAEGFEEIEAISIIDVLRRADIDVMVASISNNLMVKGSHEIVVQADILLKNVSTNAYDMIVLPGGIPGALHLNEDLSLRDHLQKAQAENKWLGAICAAPLVLGELGFLSEKKATCYPGFEDHLKGAEYTQSRVEVSDRIITGKGAGVAIDFALKIVENIKDKQSADVLRQKMIAEH